MTARNKSSKKRIKGRRGEIGDDDDGGGVGGGRAKQKIN